MDFHLDLGASPDGFFYLVVQDAVNVVVSCVHVHGFGFNVGVDFFHVVEQLLMVPDCHQAAKGHHVVFHVMPDHSDVLLALLDQFKLPGVGFVLLDQQLLFVFFYIVSAQCVIQIEGNEVDGQEEKQSHHNPVEIVQGQSQHQADDYAGNRDEHQRQPTF